MKLRLSLITPLCIALAACLSKNENKAAQDVSTSQVRQKPASLDTAYFASGCFWCTEAIFERVRGVYDVASGYSGGKSNNPTYEDVGAGRTDHAESVRVVYDPKAINYEMLVKVFFGSHDPTQLNRQGPDVGKQYRSAIWYRTEEERAKAMAIMQELERASEYQKPIVTEITRFDQFYMAEDYHQNYYELHPNQSYVANVSRPKVEKFMKEFKDWLKPVYRH